MAYTLIGSEKSPFARICRMMMIKHGTPFQFRILNFVENKEDAEALAKETPINKVPVLVDDGEKIFDSRVILKYLERKHGWPAQTIEEENLVSAVYSCLDTTVILFLMKRSGYDISAENPFLKRQRERIPSNLEFLLPFARKCDPANPSDWNYASISLFSYLVWAEQRTGLLDLKEYPDFQKFVERFGSAPGVRETAF